MWNQFKTILALAALVIFVSACGEHNQPAPNKGKNLDSERIYGESRDATPAQLPNQYEDPEGINDRSKAIYAKMYAPREVNSKRQDYPVTETQKVEEEIIPETTPTTQEDSTMSAE